MCNTSVLELGSKPGSASSHPWGCFWEGKALLTELKCRCCLCSWSMRVAFPSRARRQSFSGESVPADGSKQIQLFVLWPPHTKLQCISNSGESIKCIEETRSQISFPIFFFPSPQFVYVSPWRTWRRITAMQWSINKEILFIQTNNCLRFLVWLLFS